MVLQEHPLMYGALRTAVNVCAWLAHVLSLPTVLSRRVQKTL